MVAGLLVMVWDARVARSEPPSALRTDTAIIVNASNDAPDPSLAELRSMLLLERQFWPSGTRLALYLPPSTSQARLTLLATLYGMSDTALRHHWTEELFRGAIPAIPSSLRSTAAIGAAVVQSPGGISAVPMTEVPPGARVLLINGKRPGEPNYPLADPVAP